MLKHFAVATALLTACLALFADGEGRNEFGHAVAAREHEAAVAAAAAGERVKPKFALNSQIRDARRTYVPYPVEENEAGAAYGAPMDGAAGSGGGGSGASLGPLPSVRRSPDEAERGQLLPGPVRAQPGEGSAPSAPARSGPQAPHRPSQQEIDRLEAMSLERSGGT